MSRILVCFFFLVSFLCGEITEVPGFAKAREASAGSAKPLVVLVHGSSWHRASQLFTEKFWRAADFRAGIARDVVFTEIDVRQNPKEDEQKAFAEETQGWDRGTVRSFPAIQIYGPDGHLLESLGGSMLRELALSPPLVASKIDAIAAASAERDRLLGEMDQFKTNPEEAAKRIDALCRLPIRPETDAATKFRALDPTDRYGWAARHAFGGWEFIRATSDRIAKGETDAALVEVDAMLAESAYEPAQRCLILAAKGMLLAAKGEKEAAWAAYQEAHALDPRGPDGKAIIRHGYRTVGSSIPGATAPEG
ncbi:MAG: hypothetical protein MUF31_14775 [Akkermansiaceae bacterium]|jgi:hypothetical protein|nr:hypothetical protein [Akkermansiaceae bacterium]